eukprot:1618111-Rhodomonas_salina.1
MPSVSLSLSLPSVLSVLSESLTVCLLCLVEQEERVGVGNMQRPHRSCGHFTLCPPRESVGSPLHSHGAHAARLHVTSRSVGRPGQGPRCDGAGWTRRAEGVEGGHGGAR